MKKVNDDSNFKELRLGRDGDLDIIFDGRVIGEGEHGGPGSDPRKWTRTTEVVIYKTRNGKIVTHVHQSSETDEVGVHRAEIHDNPREALEWLKKDSGGALGRASKMAWQEACETDKDLEGMDVKRVD